MGRFFYTLVFCVLAVWGYPSAADSQNKAESFSTLDKSPVGSSFYEVAPIVREVVVQRGDPFVEVFIKGIIPEGDCYGKKEYLLENMGSHTQILARFRKTAKDEKCSSNVFEFNEKVADLDPSSPASKVVEVLSYYGWVRGELISEVLPEPSANPTNLNAVAIPAQEKR